MRRIFTIFFVVGVLFGAQNMSAQDIHFSQFYQSPLNLNPALTGVMNCQQRAVVNYRNQWASVINNPFNTFSASYDMKMPSGRRDYFGAGISLWGDVAGSANFQTAQARLSGSFSKYMSGSRTTSHYLVVGADLGLSQRSIDFSKLQWGVQHDGFGGFDPTKPNLETGLTRDAFFFGDIAVGLLWFSNLEDNNSFYVGGAAHHINRPNQSFFEEEDIELYSKYTFHAGGEITANDQLSFLPGIVTFFQGPSFQLNGGASARFHLGNRRSSTESFQFGVWTRLVNNYQWGFNADVNPPEVNEDTSLGLDAVILAARFDFSQFGIGFSYDINVSDLSVASNGNGAFEFSLVYNVCGRERRAMYCPNF